MGDSPSKTFYITAVRPVVGSILSAFILSFFLSFTDFGIPVSIAGEYEVIATQLYTTMMGAIPNFGEGAVIAMAMLVPSVASVVLLRWVDRFNFRYNKISKSEVSVNRVRDGLYLSYYLIITLALLSVFVVMFVVPFVKQWPYQPFFTLDVITRIVSDSSIWQVYEHSVAVRRLYVPQSLQIDAIFVLQNLHFKEFSSISFLHLGHCIKPILLY